MADEEVQSDETPKKGGKMPLIAGLLAAVLGGTSAFFFMYDSGIDEPAAMEETEQFNPVGEANFIALAPIIIPLGDGLANRSLRFQAHLEVARSEMSRVEALTPRIIDVLNTYLRAVEIETLQDRRALLVLRAQMLRRIQVVVDSTAIQDLLITEFFIN